MLLKETVFYIPLTKGVAVTSSHSLFSSVLGYMEGGLGNVIVSTAEFFLPEAAASINLNSSEKEERALRNEP